MHSVITMVETENNKKSILEQVSAKLKLLEKLIVFTDVETLKTKVSQ